MQIKNMYENYFKSIKENIKHDFNVFDEQTDSIINNFKETTIDQVNELLEKSEEKEFKDNLNKNLINDLEKLVESLSNDTSDIVEEITSKTSDVVLFTITNPLFSINSCNNIIKEYKSQIKAINLINKSFINKFDCSFDLFLYKVSVDYKLKNSISLYNLITKVIKQNKKILFGNLYDLNSLISEKIIDEFQNNFGDFLEEVTIIKTNANEKNKLVLIDYSKDMLQNRAKILVNKILKNNCNKIGEILNEQHQTIIKLKKSKNTKSKQLELKKLNNYFIGFNNTLFDKSLNAIIKMVSIVDCNKNDLEKNINKYNETIYKICNFEYSFEKQFQNYKKEILSRKIIAPKNNDQITNILLETEKEIIEVIKNSIIDLFKESVTDLNKTSYKTTMISYKLKDYYEVISEKEIVKLFA